MKFLFSLLFAACGWAETFLVPPYLQIGNSTPLHLEVLWHTADGDEAWGLQQRVNGEWKVREITLARRVLAEGVAPHRVYRAQLEGDAYRVTIGGKPVFEAPVHQLKPRGQSFRALVTGDTGAGTDAQRALALQMRKLDPDLVAIAGDLVYHSGKIGQYRRKFYPFYNSEEAPLMRSVPFVAAPGNHDFYGRSLSSGGMAYFLYWAQPLNGPADAIVPLEGSASARERFRAAAGDQYPRMASFSFDYGPAHWLVLDSNKQMDWTRKDFQDWVRRDLQSARGARWRFVMFHHAPYHSTGKHSEQLWMRPLAPLFEQGGVQLVFTAHVHNYERTKPMSGVVYLVTGAGGGKLHSKGLGDKPQKWQPFTAKLVSKVHSVTVLDADGERLTVRQVDVAGNEVDRFVVGQ